ncbi:hypothetical protein CLOHIR_00350 [Peptacetobacter hiranonis DSM 13275]|uniref:Phage conserved hypothetical protein C-terminal domain-containing protein n=2 Tax=Peptacetobacter TaxID=2743582 RepID=B6FWV1_PEPHT|nr:hypothetical protein CLOHIR_00350 [Peptacetobacter hiranonis DSM 13275]
MNEMRVEVLGFKQEELMRQGVSLDEALILRDIEDIINSGKTATYFCEEDGKMYHWIFYNKVLDDIPILNISKERLARIIIHNLCEKPEDFDEKFESCSERTQKDMRQRKYLGLLKSKVVKNTAEGTRSYFTFTDKFYEMREEIFSEEGMTNASEGCDVNVEWARRKRLVRQNENVGRGSDVNVFSDKTKTCSRTRRKRRNKDIYINIYIDIVEYLNKKANKNYKHNSDKTRRFIDARLNEGFTLEDFKKVIDNKCRSWLNDERMNQYLRPETLFGTKFEAYLNEMPISQKKIEKAVESAVESSFSRFTDL